MLYLNCWSLFSCFHFAFQYLYVYWYVPTSIQLISYISNVTISLRMVIRHAWDYIMSIWVMTSLRTCRSIWSSADIRMVETPTHTIHMTAKSIIIVVWLINANFWLITLIAFIRLFSTWKLECLRGKNYKYKKNVKHWMHSLRTPYGNVIKKWKVSRGICSYTFSE